MWQQFVNAFQLNRKTSPLYTFVVLVKELIYSNLKYAAYDGQYKFCLFYQHVYLKELMLYLTFYKYVWTMFIRFLLYYHNKIKSITNLLKNTHKNKKYKITFKLVKGITMKELGKIRAITPFSSDFGPQSPSLKSPHLPTSTVARHAA